MFCLRSLTSEYGKTLCFLVVAMQPPTAPAQRLYICDIKVGGMVVSFRAATFEPEAMP